MKYVLILLGCLLHFNGWAQDLNARVQILAPQVPNVNRNTIQNLETSIRDFLNNRKWLAEKVQPNERIDCNFTITITEWDNQAGYKAEAQIVSTRPVFNSSYNTTLINISDKEFDFSYLEGQSLDFSDDNYLNNLSSLLAFYAYLIAGADFDSFSKLGGSAYFAKADNVVQQAQGAGARGWKAFDSNRNRYWIIQNLQNKSNQPYREALYEIHRLGFDVLAENAGKGRKNILQALEKIQRIDLKSQTQLLPQLFSSAKGDEMVNLFAAAPAPEKSKAFSSLSAIDPANLNRYQTLQR